jgi:DNA polymerase-3 subunit alpha
LDSRPSTLDPAAPGAAIRFGLAGIKGVGEAAAQKIIGEREAGGPFRDFHDFLLRVDARAINKRVLECLVLTGAFDYSGATREELFGQIDAVLGALAELQRKYPSLRREVPAAAPPAEPAETMLFDLADTATAAAPPDPAVLAAEFARLLKVTVTRRNGNGAPPAGDAGHDQHSFFDIVGSAAPPAGGPARTAEPSRSEDRVLTPTTRLQYEKELLGFYISGHPMNAYAGLAEAINTVPEDELLDQPNQSEFRLCGIATGIVKKLSRKDNRPWAAFTLATKRGSLPMNMFSDAYETYAKHLVAETPVLVQGNLLAGNDGVRINVRECYPLDPAVTSLVQKVTWLLYPDHPELPSFLRALRTTVEASYGNTHLEFAFVFEDRIAPFAEPSAGLGWKLVPAQFQQLRAHPAVAGTLVETKRLQLRETRRSTKR